MSNLQNDFINFVQYLLDDSTMTSWFLSLSSLSPQERILELRNTAVTMISNNVDDDIVRTLGGLSDQEAFDSIRAVLLAELNLRDR